MPVADPSVIDRLGSAGSAVMAMINGEVTRQATFIAFIDDFWLLMWISLAALPLVLLMKSGKQSRGGPQPSAAMLE
jgi:DHA2 family multidrug resistance protein